MENHRSLCPMNLTLEIFGDKWSLLIIRDIMFKGFRHFRELLHGEEKIASNILTDRLNMLEREGILTKRQDPEHKQKFIYSLTERGIDLVPLLVEIGAWSFKHQPADNVRYEHARSLIDGGKDAQAELKKKLTSEHLSNS